MIGQYRAVTEDGEIVYGFGAIAYEDKWYLLNEKTKELLNDREILSGDFYNEIDPDSLATLVNAEGLDEASSWAEDFDQKIEKVTRKMQIELPGEPILEEVLKVARYASYYQLGYGMTSGGEVVEVMDAGKKIVSGVIALKDGELIVEDKYSYPFINKKKGQND